MSKLLCLHFETLIVIVNVDKNFSKSNQVFWEMKYFYSINKVYTQPFQCKFHTKSFKGSFHTQVFSRSEELSFHTNLKWSFLKLSKTAITKTKKTKNISWKKQDVAKNEKKNIYIFKYTCKGFVLLIAVANTSSSCLLKILSTSPVDLWNMYTSQPDTLITKLKNKNNHKKTEIIIISLWGSRRAKLHTLASLRLLGFRQQIFIFGPNQYV